MSNSKVAVVTGSNKGIGFAIVKNLCANFSGTVYLTSRDVGRGEKAVEELKKLGLMPAFHQLDIDSDESVNKFAEYLKKVHSGLDVLVNNAGIAFKVDATESTAVQAEVTINTNYYGTLRVCNALFPLLRPHARVVNVSSSCGHLLNIPDRFLRMQFSDSDLTVPHLSLLLYKFVEATETKSHVQQGWPSSTYVVSKVGVSALTLIQHREFLKDPRQDIVINHVHPGYVNTDMSSHKGPLSIEQGAAAACYLALLPEGTTSPKGDYVWHDKTIVDWVNGPTPAPSSSMDAELLAKEAAILNIRKLEGNFCILTDSHCALELLKEYKSLRRIYAFTQIHLSPCNSSALEDGISSCKK